MVNVTSEVDKFKTEYPFVCPKCGSRMMTTISYTADMKTRMCSYQISDAGLCSDSDSLKFPNSSNPSNYCFVTLILVFMFLIPSPKFQHYFCFHFQYCTAKKEKKKMDGWKLLWFTCLGVGQSFVIFNSAQPLQIDINISQITGNVKFGAGSACL